MSGKTVLHGWGRRRILKAGLVLGAVPIAAPFIVKARGEEPVKIGFVNPLTGIYTAFSQNEVHGATLAVEQINAKGGILGRPVQLLVEDSANDVGTGVQKGHKLLERDQVNFMMGDVNSSVALALGQVTNEKGVVMIVPGGHTDGITGKDCHWNVFRVCNTTKMQANAVASGLIKQFGKKWYYLTPDYAFGHTIQAGLESAAAKLGGVTAGSDLAPLGTTDFSAYLIKARAANPDVLVVLTAGQDAINTLKQAVAFGLDKQLHIAGAQMDLENLEGLPAEARIGTWVFEWYWRQPGVPHVEEFVAAIKQKTGKVPTAHTWFGYAATWSLALGANTAKSTEGVQVAKALGGLKLPPEVALQPSEPFYRTGDHQLMTSLYVGNARTTSTIPEDLFEVTQVVTGAETAAPESETGCKMTWPA